MIVDYLKTSYMDGGRGPDAYDCYGLVLDVRRDMGLPDLPSYEHIGAEDKGGLTDGCLAEMSQRLEVSEPKQGAIATVWRGKLCVHVGVIVEKEGRIGVFETNRKTGPRWLSLNKFERAYLRVVYLYDRSL